MDSKRLQRERKTVRIMIEIYCREYHKNPGGLCAECQDLVQYSEKRVDHCVFGSEKPTCAKCPIHCYKTDMREKIKAVMRFSGPKMIFKHPVLAIYHLLDSKRKVPNLPKVQK